MTNPDSHPAESPALLGHAIVAFDRIIERHLHDQNYTAADEHIAALDDINATIDDLTDADTRTVLTGILKSLTIRHNVTRQDVELPNTAPDTFIAGTPCGHRHRGGTYADGCAYATHIAWATTAANDNDHTTAQHHALTADRTLWPLGDINNPESLRDFIAGANSGFEAHLRSLGTPITS